ncbi:MAG TPA: trypsin-like peptidase domain-containing protein [Terricaulis sp.]|nr:trypsin-like peptidase domain-containing protein [Terricaulis sp.]HRP10217.1 trypsin-like peptidase domain-containing protein [Terricaulis sp.]
MIRQDFTEAARFAFFASDYPGIPFWTPGGTAFLVSYRSSPYLVTCAHVLDHGCGSDLVVTSSKYGNSGVAPCRAHRVHDLDGGQLDMDMSDVAVLAFGDGATFGDTAYIVDPETVGTSELDDHLLVHGCLNEHSRISETEITPSFRTFEFSDVGATSNDPFIRQASARYSDADFTSLAGLSGSPVFNQTQTRLCGMVVRGGGGDPWHIRYVDIFDVMKLLEAVHSDELRITYSKTVKRRP